MLQATIKSVARDAGIQVGGTAGVAMLVDNVVKGACDEPLATTPYFFQCVYIDAAGDQHLFRSKTYFAHLSDDAIGKTATIYYEGDDYARYVVEI